MPSNQSVGSINQRQASAAFDNKFLLDQYFTRRIRLIYDQDKSAVKTVQMIHPLAYAPSPK